MNAQKQLLAVFAILTALDLPVAAQVEKVAIRTTGISCGVCAAVSEIQFSHMPDIEDVAISLSKETITLSFKAGASFHPRQIRQILQPLQVGIVQFQMTALGRVQEEGGKRFFVAGKDKFVLAPAASASAIPLDTAVLIEGVINDGFDPAQLKISNFKPLKK